MALYKTTYPVVGPVISSLTKRPVYRGGNSGVAFLPTDLSNLLLWLDASDASTITETLGAVSQWDDKSGNGNHVTQGTASLQPVSGSNTLNSLNVIDFDGSDALVRTSLGVTGSQNRSLLLVGKSNDSSHNAYFNIGPNTGPNAWTLLSLNNANQTLSVAIAAGSTPGVGIPANNWNIVGAKLDGTRLRDHSVYLNGAEFLQTGAATTPIDTLDTNIRIGADFNIANLNGRIAELVFGSIDWSNTELNNLGNYYFDKWGTTWTGL
jgi:hypothetical protein